MTTLDNCMLPCVGWKVACQMTGRMQALATADEPGGLQFYNTKCEEHVLLCDMQMHNPLLACCKPTPQPAASVSHKHKSLPPQSPPPRPRAPLLARNTPGASIGRTGTQTSKKLDWCLARARSSPGSKKE